MIVSTLKEIQIWPRVGIIEDDLRVIEERIETAKFRQLPIPQDDIDALGKQATRLTKIMEKLKCLNN